MAVPGAPVLSGRNQGNGSARLTWPAVPGATGYNLYRGTVSESANVNGRNEKQTVTIDATGGTFKLTYAAAQTAAIAFDASAQDVEDALVALSTIALGDVDVTKVGSVYTVEFMGLLARTDVAQMTSDATLLTGATHTATVATSVAGIGPVALSVDSPAYNTGTDNTRYFYKVRAKNAEGEGAASNEVAINMNVVADATDPAPTGALLANRHTIAEG